MRQISARQFRKQIDVITKRINQFAAKPFTQRLPLALLDGDPLEPVEYPPAERREVEAVAGTAVDPPEITNPR